MKNQQQHYFKRMVTNLVISSSAWMIWSWNILVECMPETDRCGFVTATTSRHLKLLSRKCAKIRTLSIFSENNYAPLDWNNNGFEAQEGHHLDSLVQDTNDGGSPQCVISTGILVFLLKKSFLFCGSKIAKIGIYLSKGNFCIWKAVFFYQKSNSPKKLYNQTSRDVLKK